MGDLLDRECLDQGVTCLGSGPLLEEHQAVDLLLEVFSLEALQADLQE